MTTLAKVYLVLIVVFGLIILIDCLRLRRKASRYAGYGLLFGVIRLAIGFTAFAVFPDLLRLTEPGILIAGCVLLLVGITIYTSIGMYSSSKFGLPAAPLTRALFGNVALLRGLKPGSYLLSILLLVGGAVAYSSLLFAVTSPSMSELLRSLSSDGSPALEPEWRVRAIAVVVLLEFALAEEMFFRLGLQNWFAKVLRLGAKSYWVAVVISSAIWSLAHASMLDPEWVKLVQVFPMGIALGFMFRKFGVECCFFAHAAFNIVMMYLGPSLIQ